VSPRTNVVAVAAMSGSVALLLAACGGSASSTAAASRTASSQSTGSSQSASASQSTGSSQSASASPLPSAAATSTSAAVLPVDKGSCDAPGSCTYTDPAGDAASAVGDITTIIVGSSATTGLLTFNVYVKNRGGLAANDQMWIELDTDANPNTGETFTDPAFAGKSGIDYYIYLDNTGTSATAGLYHWPTGATKATLVNADASFSNTFIMGVWHLGLDPAQIGNPQTFNFWIDAASGTSADPAPDSGEYSFSTS
jgi:hypothetical protein